MHDTNLMAFKADLRNVNENSIVILQKQIKNTKLFKEYFLSYTKNTFP